MSVSACPIQVDVQFPVWPVGFREWSLGSGLAFQFRLDRQTTADLWGDCNSGRAMSIQVDENMAMCGHHC
jgi:hypothetical protein